MYLYTYIYIYIYNVCIYIHIYIYIYIYLWTFKFLRQKACEPLNQMTSNFVGYLIYVGKMHIYKKKCEVSVVLFV